MKRLGRVLAACTVMLLLVSLLGAGAAVGIFWHYGQGLPDYQQLAKYEPPMVTRVHAGDGRLLAEFAKQKRVFVPVEAIPKLIVKAFLSAEDKHFYEHPGIDFYGIARAIITNLSRIGSNQRLVGASTITQQVAKNFLLTNEVSIDRKVKEAILAVRIEQALSKDRILELYLNEIYLGFGSYGVAAAALNYFDRPLDGLSIAEAAYIAGLPKAPNNYHPTRRPAAAVGRRNYVVGRMLADGYITEEQADAARTAPLVIRERTGEAIAQADYFVEEVRRDLVAKYGEGKLYGGGLSVRTTLNPQMQRIADRVLQNGLIAYDRRHGWRGPLVHGSREEDWREVLKKTPVSPGVASSVPNWQKAAVIFVWPDRAAIGLEDGSEGYIPLSELKWARAWMNGQKRGPVIRHPEQVLSLRDIVLVERLGPDKDGKPAPAGAFALRQPPEIEGAVVALDPHTGRVLAMSGGFARSKSQYNRVTQARRQPGSAFKPFVYLAAMDHGFTPSSIVLDAPVVVDQGPGLRRWKPANYSNKFYGPSPLRLGIEKSRNLMTVRLAQTIGMETIVEYAKRLGVVKDMPRMLSMALGAGETTLLDITTGYAMLVNGGKRITPTLIDRIQDRHGKTIYRHEGRICTYCGELEWNGQQAPEIPDNREVVADPVSAYQLVSMLEGVVRRGTGRRIRVIGKPLAGKTGTTNDSIDTWFIGFSPDLAVGVFAGFDKPRSLGRGETGSSVAVPIFRDFMAAALKDQPPIPFRVPKGVQLIRVDPTTGRRAQPGQRHTILEAFKAGTEPPLAVSGNTSPVGGTSLGGVKGLY
jgi:penicillin-binding protein 1A